MVVLSKIWRKKKLILSKYTIFFAFVLLAPILSLAQTKDISHKLRRVVIDAGHGGKDPGAIGKISQEKDITLAVALELGRRIKAELKDVKVIYTREDDRFIELFERANIANKSKADLFISIHINSSKNKEASGAEAWVLGLHRSDENLDVAKRENAVIQLEGNVEKNYGFDPNSPAGNIMMTMQQNAFLNQSILFAKKVEAEFAEKMNRKNRGVHQAGFAVLYKTIMPSCLIELGFISNKEEEHYLKSHEGRDEIAGSIFRAFKKFKLEYEGQKVEGKKNTAEEEEDANNKNSTDSKAKSREQDSGQKEEKQQDRTGDSANRTPVEKSATLVKPSGADASTSVAHSTQTPDTNIVAQKAPMDTVKAEVTKKSDPAQNVANKKIYRVQIMAMPTLLPSSHPVYALFSDVEALKEQNVYRYVCGKFETLQEAMARKEALKRKGHPDAFIAIYEGNKRVGTKF